MIRRTILVNVTLLRVTFAAARTTAAPLADATHVAVRHEKSRCSVLSLMLGVRLTNTVGVSPPGVRHVERYDHAGRRRLCIIMPILTACCADSAAARDAQLPELPSGKDCRYFALTTDRQLPFRRESASC